MKIYQFIIVIVLSSFIVNCKKNNDEKNNRFFYELNKYIDSSESEARNNEMVNEYNIYLVVFKEKEKLCYVDIFENPYYIREGIDGHMKIRENLIVFYGLNNDCNEFIDIKDLNADKIIDYYHEDSKEVQEFTYDPLIVSYKIDNGKLIMQESNGGNIGSIPN